MNLNKSNWISLLPVIYNKKILKIGTSNKDNISALLYFKPKSLVCVGNSMEINTDVDLKFFENINHISINSFDILILDEIEESSDLWDFSSTANIFISELSKKLNIGGIILIFFPRSFLNLRRRFLIRRAFSKFNFHCRYYLCDPCTSAPATIYPYLRKNDWLLADLLSEHEAAITSWLRLKMHLRSIIFNMSKIYNPFRGLIIVAHKGKNFIEYNEQINKAIQSVLSSDQNAMFNIEIIIVVNTRYKMRQFIFVYNNNTGRLLLFIKITFDIENIRWNLQDEYRNNLLLRKYVNKDDNLIFSFPNALRLQNESNMSLLLQSPVHGLNLNNLIMENMHKKPSFIINLLDRAVEVIPAISNQLSYVPEDQLNSIDPIYYEDYLGIVDERFKVNENYIYVQHGDFTSGNIFMDTKTNQWIIIDWEWMAKGYPPLFDLFCFLTSIKFSKKQKHDIYSKHYFENQFQSFIHTYFDENWFSKHVRQVILNYGKRINLPNDIIFYSFLNYLCFCCNKYRLFYKYSNFQQHYESLLQYSVQHDRDFIIFN